MNSASGGRARRIRLIDWHSWDLERRKVCEEASRTKESIAHRLSIEYQLPWHSIDMDECERRAAGILDALRNRPSSPDDKHERTINVRIPADAIREDHFVEQILQECHDKDNVLVLQGDLHVEATAEKTRARGHNVSINATLVPVKRWTSIVFMRS